MKRKQRSGAIGPQRRWGMHQSHFSVLFNVLYATLLCPVDFRRSTDRRTLVSVKRVEISRYISEVGTQLSAWPDKSYDLTDHTVILLEGFICLYEHLPRLLVRANGAPLAKECLLVMCVNSARQEIGFLFLMGLLNLLLSGV